jgi:DNA-binding LacI/PurR family transcriptional regulator
LKPNIYDIAKDAGVSIATVSRVLNNSSRVSAKTRQKVLALMEEKGYTPKVMTSKITQITIFIRGYLNNGVWSHFGPYESTILNGLTHELSKHNNINVQVFPYRSGTPDEHIIKFLQNNNTDGVIFIGSDDDIHLGQLLEAENIRTLHCNTQGKGINYVSVNNQQGTLDMLQGLWNEGHRKIAYLGYDSHNWSEIERLKSWATFLSEKRVDDKKLRYVQNLNEGQEQSGLVSGYRMGKFIGKQKVKPTAILAQNSEYGTGLLKALLESGLSLPDDMSVVCYDDFPFMSYLSPSLSTISQPLRKLGESAARSILEIISGATKTSQLILPAEIHIRESSGPAPL